jgi:hypothetical protein
MTLDELEHDIRRHLTTLTNAAARNPAGVTDACNRATTRILIAATAYATGDDPELCELRRQVLHDAAAPRPAKPPKYADVHARVGDPTNLHLNPRHADGH